MDGVKFCKDCFYFIPESKSPYQYPKCRRKPTTDLVTGEEDFRSAKVERDPGLNADCGPAAQYFEQK